MKRIIIKKKVFMVLMASIIAVCLFVSCNPNVNEDGFLPGSKPDAGRQSDTLPGVFTVNSEKKTVGFAKGNLYYNTTTGTFGLEDSQLDYQTNWDADHVDKFYWSSKVAAAVAEDYEDSGLSSSESFFAAGEFSVNETSGWFTLSSDEWTYILEERSTSVTGTETENARYATVMENGVNGLLLFPDAFAWDDSTMGEIPAAINDMNFGWEEATEYTAAQFAAQEKAGIVFLPCAGYRSGDWFMETGTDGYYNNSGLYDTNNAWFLNFNSYGPVEDTGIRSRGKSVRLCLVSK